MLKWFFGLNRHVRTAIMVAPFLGIGGYGLADYFLVGPQEKKETIVQELVAQGQCNLTVNQCKFSYEKLTVSLVREAASEEGLLRIDIRTNQPVRGVKFALVQGRMEQKIYADQTVTLENWVAEFPQHALKSNHVVFRLALAQTGRIFIAEFPAEL